MTSEERKMGVVIAFHREPERHYTLQYAASIDPAPWSTRQKHGWWTTNPKGQKVFFSNIDLKRAFVVTQ